MGGAAILKDVGEAISPWMRSTETIMEKTPIGKSLSEFLKNKYEPELFKTAKQYMSGGTNPDAAWQAARTDVTNLAFGRRRQAFIPFLKVAQSQGGPTAASELADTLNIYFHDDNPYWRIRAKQQGVQIGANANYKIQSKAESTIKSIAAPMFLPRISIPHAAQAPLNSLIVDGTKATLKAFAEFASSPSAALKFSDQAGAQSLETLHEFLNATRGNSTFRNLIDPLRKVFNFERKWGIAFSAVSGKHAALDAAADYFATQSKRSELQLKVLGLDPAAILKQGGNLSSLDIETAAFRAASEIMGFRSPLETPYKWEENPSARIAMIYKHYGFRQARLIKDALLRAKEAEGWGGVAKVASVIGSSFFIAGEAIKGTEDLLSGREPWNKDEEKNNLLGNEWIDGIAHAGGFGVMYSILRSAKHNHLGGYLMGPLVSSSVDIIQDTVNMRGRSLARDIGRKFGLPGTFIVNQALPPTKGKKPNNNYY